MTGRFAVRAAAALLLTLGACTQKAGAPLKPGEVWRPPADAEQLATGRTGDTPIYVSDYDDGATVDFEFSVANGSETAIVFERFLPHRSAMLVPVEFRALLRDGSPVDLGEVSLEPGRELRVSVRALMTRCEHYQPGGATGLREIRYSYRDGEGGRSFTATVALPLEVRVVAPPPPLCPRTLPVPGSETNPAQ